MRSEMLNMNGDEQVRIRDFPKGGVNLTSGGPSKGVPTPEGGSQTYNFAKSLPKNV